MRAHDAQNLLGVLAIIALSGCVRYQPQPLDAGKILQELRATTLERFSGPSEKGETLFDPKDGISEDEAVSVALVLNPHIRALRMEKGLGGAQLLAAGLWPDPEVDASWIDRSDGTVLEASLLQALSWGERGLQKEKANLRLEEIHAEVGFAEWRLAQEVRSLFTDLMATEEAVRLATQNLALRQRLLGLIETRRDLGAATPLEVNLTSLELSNQRRAVLAAERERDLARQGLNRSLGLSPAAQVPLQMREDPWALQRSPSLSVEQLEEVAVKNRLDLMAAERSYEQAEKALQIATRGQYPRLKIGPSFGKEEGEDGLGVGIGVEIPLWNRNRGEIAERLAERKKQAEEFRARLAALRSELAQAQMELDRQAALVRLFETEIRPKLDQSISLTEETFKSGKLDLAALLTLQDRVLQARREDLEVRNAYRKALIDYEGVLGIPLKKLPSQREQERR